MNAVQALERAAFAAHRRGESWAAFWQQHGDAIRAVEPYNVAAFHRLCGRLLALLVSGDDCGCHSLDGLPDAYDVLPTPDDVGTQARLDWAAIGTPPLVWVLPRRCYESIPLSISVFSRTRTLNYKNGAEDEPLGQFTNLFCDTPDVPYLWMRTANCDSLDAA